MLCCWKHFYPSSCHGPHHKLKKYSPTSSANQFLLLIVETEQKNYSRPMALTSPSFLVDCCMFWAALGKMTWKMVSVLWQFCVKIGEIARTHIVFTLKYTPCLLHSVRIKGVRDRSWQGQKWPCFSCPCVEIWRFTHSTNLGENGCFFKEVVSVRSEGRGTLPW